MKRLIVLIFFIIFSSILFAQKYTVYNQDQFNKTTELKKEKAQVHYKLALSLYKKNDIEGAISELKLSIGLDPLNWLYYYNLGTIYLSDRQLDKAEDALNKSLLYNPNAAETYYNLAQTAYFKKEYYKAIKHYKNSLAIDPKDINAYINLGLSYRAIELFDKAEEQYQKALQLDYKCVPALLNLGTLYKVKNQNAMALKMFKEVLTIEPNNKEALYNVSLIEQKKSENHIKSNLNDNNHNQQQKINQPEFSENISKVTGMKVSSPLSANFLFSNSTSADNSTDLGRIEPKLKEYRNKYYTSEGKNVTLKTSLDSTIGKLEKNIQEKENLKDKFKMLSENTKLEMTSFKEKLISMFADKLESTILKQRNLNDRIIRLEAETKLTLSNYKNEIKNELASELNNFKQDINGKIDLLINKIDSLANNKTTNSENNINKTANIGRNSFMSELGLDQPLTNDIESIQEFTPDLLNEEYSNDFTIPDYELNTQNFTTDFNSDLNFEIPEVSGFEMNSISEPLTDFNMDNNTFDLDMNFDLNNNLELQNPESGQFNSEPLNINTNNINGININEASKEELIQAGLSEDIALNIIWVRENMGRFNTSNDLLNIPGLSVEQFNELKQKVSY